MGERVKIPSAGAIAEAAIDCRMRGAHRMRRRQDRPCRARPALADLARRDLIGRGAFFSGRTGPPLDLLVDRRAT